MDNVNQRKTVTKTVTKAKRERGDEYDTLLREVKSAWDDLAPGHAASLKRIGTGGSLEVRMMPGGQRHFYWRYTEAGHTEREPIGQYDSGAPAKSKNRTALGFSIVAAWEAAKALSLQNKETPGGLRAKRERDAAELEAQQRARAIREKYTLQALCEAYCDHLRARGKASHGDARNVFTNHLIGAYPELASRPARDVQKVDIVAAIRRLQDAGKKTTARKLRAYLRAAYALALTADSDTELPEVFLHFGITDNPLLTIKPIKSTEDKNPLSLPELRKYWRALKAEPDAIGAALRLHVLTGGQRVAQLARLHSRDIQADALQLMDPKGRRAEPRAHLLPITPAIRAELKKLSSVGYTLSTDGGTTPMHASSLSAWASDVGARAGIEGFQLKRVRSAVETELARAGIPLDLRGQLQSHGISGVQAKNYDAYEYMKEKRAALEALHGLLERKDSKNVTPIWARKRA